MENKYFEKYFTALWDTDKDRAYAVIEEALQNGVTPEQIIFELLIPSIDKMIGTKVNYLQTTLSHHFLTAKIADDLTDKMIQKMGKPSVKKEVIVIGSAFGDFHGLGKKIVAGCLRAEMYEVYDLGLNVSAQKFVDEAKAKNAKIIGVSSMMVHTAKGENGPRAIRQILDDEKSNIKLIVGGAPYRYDFELYKEVGAHGFAATAPEVSKLIESLLGGK